LQEVYTEVQWAT